MELWSCRGVGASSSTSLGPGTSACIFGAKNDGGQESPRQPPDSPNPSGDVRRKVPSHQEDGEAGGPGGDGAKAEGGSRKRGVLEVGFLGRRRAAPPVPLLSSLPSGSDGGGSDSSANASPSPTKPASSTSPRHRKLGSDSSNQDSSL